MANDNGGDRRGRGRWTGFDFSGGSGQSGRNPWRFSIIYILGAILLLFLLQGLFSRGPQKAPNLNAFFSQLDAHQVKSVVISVSSVTWTRADGAQFSATLPPNFDPTNLVTQAKDAGANV